VRLGDPETEVVLPRLKNDLVDLFEAVSRGELDSIELEVDKRSAVTVMAVSGGYPGSYAKGKEIRGLEKIEDSVVFHAGTAKQNDLLVTNGGRVLAVTSLSEDFKKALQISYRNLEQIDFDGIYYRKDLGFDL
jgi:phosphoribosylamine--glycine ligase